MHKRAFDKHYGMKYRKPAFVIDTRNRSSQSSGPSTGSKAKESKQRKYKGSQEDFASLLEKHYVDFTKMHSEKNGKI